MEKQGQTTKEKREALQSLIERGLTMIHVDARQPGVTVPRDHRGDFHLRLNLSYRFRYGDLEVSDWGVRATLTFGGHPAPCRVPWSAIWAMTRHEEEVGWVWPLDMPPEIASQLGEATVNLERQATSTDIPDTARILAPDPKPAPVLAPAPAPDPDPADEPDTHPRAPHPGARRAYPLLHTVPEDSATSNEEAPEPPDPPESSPKHPRGPPNLRLVK